jgi:hypothetical protein
MLQEHDFASLAALVYATDCLKEKLLTEFTYGRISMDEFNRKYDLLDEQIDRLQIRYIIENRLIEQVEDTLQRHELIFFSLN